MLLVCLAYCVAAAAAGSSIVIDDHVRVTALSDIALRIEPKGPNGFEDRSTFLAVGRGGFAGLELTQTAKSGDKTTLKTSAYTIDIVATDPTDICAAPKNDTDLAGATRVSTCSAHAQSCLAPGASQADCCNNCTAHDECLAFIYQPSTQWCWLMATAGSPISKSDRVAGGVGAGVAATVTSPDGTELWSSADLTATGSALP